MPPKEKYDFSSLRYDVTKVPKGELVIDHFPELAEYEEFSKEWHDMLLRVVFLTVDEGCPFVKLIRDDIQRRVRKVFEYLGYEDSELEKKILAGESRDYNRMVDAFFRMTDSFAYINWHTKLMNYHYITSFLRTPPGKDVKREMVERSKLEEELENIHRRLVEMERELFPDAHTRKVVKSEVAKIRQFAEQYAVEKQVI